MSKSSSLVHMLSHIIITFMVRNFNIHNFSIFQEYNKVGPLYLYIPHPWIQSALQWEFSFLKSCLCGSCKDFFISEIPKQHKSYLHHVYIVIEIISNLEMVLIVWEICIHYTKYYAILYKRSEHLQIYYHCGSWNQNPPQIPKQDSVINYSHHAVQQIF